jgi:hypothetical protein
VTIRPIKPEHQLPRWAGPKGLPEADQWSTTEQPPAVGGLKGLPCQQWTKRSTRSPCYHRDSHSIMVWRTLTTARQPRKVTWAWQALAGQPPPQRKAGAGALAGPLALPGPGPAAADQSHQARLGHSRFLLSWDQGATVEIGFKLRVRLEAAVEQISVCFRFPINPVSYHPIAFALSLQARI